MEEDRVSIHHHPVDIAHRPIFGFHEHAIHAGIIQRPDRGKLDYAEPGKSGGSVPKCQRRRSERAEGESGIALGVSIHLILPSLNAKYRRFCRG